MLQRFGFSAYENQVYQVLLASDEPMDPTSISKYSNVPRAKIYEVLSKMFEKGVAMEVISNKKKGYFAVPKDIVIKKLEAEFKKNIDLFKSDKSKILINKDDLWRFKTDDLILSTLKQMIVNANESILISLWKKDFYDLKPLLEEKEASGISVHVHIVGQAEANIKNLHILAEPSGENSLEIWRLLIVDNNDIIFGAFDNGCWDSIRTTINPFVKFFTEFYYHDVVLTKIVDKYYKDILKNDQEIDDLLTNLKY